MNKVNGFTLFELLVSISIIGILTAVVAFSFSAAQKKARDARRVTDMSSIQKAAEVYYSISGYNYPTTMSGKWEFGTQTVLENFPVDPKNAGSLIYSCNPLTVSAYCCCALMEEAGRGNSGAGCVFTDASKTYYCVKNQQ